MHAAGDGNEVGVAGIHAECGCEVGLLVLDHGFPPPNTRSVMSPVTSPENFLFVLVWTGFFW